MSLIMDTEQEKKISINYKVPERTRKIIRVVAASQGIKRPDVVIKALDESVKNHPVSVS